MRQFGVYRNRNAASRSAYPLLLNVQSDLIAETGTRVVVPLVRAGGRIREMPPLVPKLDIDGVPYLMVSPLLSSVELSDLGTLEADLSALRGVVLGALDFLVAGV